MIPAATIARLRELESAATEGPWEVGVEDAQADMPPDYAIWMPEVGHDGALVEMEVDAALIAELRNHADDLLDAAEEVARLRAAVEVMLGGLLLERETRPDSLQTIEWADTLVDRVLDGLRAILAAPTTRGDR